MARSKARRAPKLYTGPGSFSGATHKPSKPQAKLIKVKGKSGTLTLSAGGTASEFAGASGGKGKGGGQRRDRKGRYA